MCIMHNLLEIFSIKENVHILPVQSVTVIIEKGIVNFHSQQFIFILRLSEKKKTSLLKKC